MRLRQITYEIGREPKKQLIIGVTDIHNVEFAAEQILKMIEEFLQDKGLDPKREPGYVILNVDTSEWEVP